MKLFLKISKNCLQFKEKGWTPWSAFEANLKVGDKRSYFFKLVLLPSRLFVLIVVSWFIPLLIVDTFRYINHKDQLMEVISHASKKFIFKLAIDIFGFRLYNLSTCQGLKTFFNVLSPVHVKEHRNIHLHLPLTLTLTCSSTTFPPPTPRFCLRPP